jgi:pantoate--beta-alanine ligase
MKTATTITELRSALTVFRSKGKTVGFVPTMGALHEGHLSLVHLCKAQTNVTVVSIFVNPTQFGASEDFNKYPRTIEADTKMLEQEGTDLLFLPTKEEMYPPGPQTSVKIGGVTERYEGAIRPGHFQGVATVVSSLFNIVGADKAFFGQKDAQQIAVIKKLVRDLHFPTEIVVGETVREPDGLAMSSRNRYLTAPERERALVISKTLFMIRDLAERGQTPEMALLKGRDYFKKTGRDITLEYLDLVDSETFKKTVSFKEHDELTVIIAAKTGTTRLLDNVVLRKK